MAASKINLSGLLTDRCETWYLYTSTPLLNKAERVRFDMNFVGQYRVTRFNTDRCEREVCYLGSDVQSAIETFNNLVDNLEVTRKDRPSPSPFKPYAEWTDSQLATGLENCKLMGWDNSLNLISAEIARRKEAQSTSEEI